MSDMADPGSQPARHPIRALWQRVETIHAVTYFASESIEAAREAGLRGFWMGYFGFRAAPLGAATAATVEATFANFAPAMVERAIPDAWGFAAPADLVVARRTSAAAALRRLAPDIVAMAEDQPHLEALEHLAEQGSTLGRPLAAANRGLVRAEDPVEQLWQACTTLREFRGDGHLIALASAKIDGLEAHRLMAAERDLDPELLRDNRGWSVEAWDEAGAALTARGYLTTSGRALTAEGVSLRRRIEDDTDRLAMPPGSSRSRRRRSAIGLTELTDWLDAPARTIAASDTIPFPNPMGLPDDRAPDQA